MHSNLFLHYVSSLLRGGLLLCRSLLGSSLLLCWCLLGSGLLGCLLNRCLLLCWCLLGSGLLLGWRLGSCLLLDGLLWPRSQLRLVECCCLCPGDFAVIVQVSLLFSWALAGGLRLGACHFTVVVGIAGALVHVLVLCFGHYVSLLPPRVPM